MDANTLVTLVGSLGFPIIACGAVMYYVYEFTTKLTEQITQMNTVLQHLLSVMENNTQVISQVYRRMEEK